MSNAPGTSNMQSSAEPGICLPDPRSYCINSLQDWPCQVPVCCRGSAKCQEDALKSQCPVVHAFLQPGPGLGPCHKALQQAMALAISISEVVRKPTCESKVPTCGLRNRFGQACRSMEDGVQWRQATQRHHLWLISSLLVYPGPEA